MRGTERVAVPAKLAVIAALPREIAGLVRGVAADAELRRRGVFLYRVEGAVVVAAGMGAGRVALAVEAAMAAAPVTVLLSVGVVGACDPKLRAGDVIRAGVVVDARTGERYDNSQYRQVLVTAAEIASVAEKRRLFASYYASAVDMEAATAGRMARAHGLYFAAIKTISDEAEFELPELARFATSEGQFREWAFAAHAALRPAMWGKVVGLAKGSDLAIAALTRELRSQMEWYRERA
jgi:adenosylhomocysteine nucleosidase